MSYFIFDNIHSKEMNLRIAHVGSQGIVRKSTFADVEIVSDRSARRTEPYQYGRRLAPTREISMEIFHAHGGEFLYYERETIGEWLFGRADNHILTILDQDMGNKNYLCRLTRPEVIMLGGRVIGWRFTVTSALPYSFTDIIETSYEINDSAFISFHNLNQIEEYLWPEIEIEMLGDSTSILIQNENDNNRIFNITDIRQGETIYVDNDRRMIKTASGDDLFNTFNLNFLRFNLGHNRLFVSGSARLVFRNRWKKAIGAF